MTDDNTKEHNPPIEPTTLQPSRFQNKRTAMLAGMALVVLAAGAAAGAGGTKLAQRFQPQSVMLLQPSPIDKMQDDTPVAVKGRVAEIFGNKFIVQDDSGRALVDLGPRGENPSGVTKGDTITVQGRFDRGLIRAQVLVYADGRSEAFGPPKSPHERGPRAERGPDRGPPAPRHAERGPDRRPPPPPGADRGPPPPPPADRAPPPPAADGVPPPPPADALPPPPAR